MRSPGLSTWPGRPASGWSSPSRTIGTPLTIVACTPSGFDVQRPAPFGKSWTNSLWAGPIVAGVEHEEVGGVAGQEHAAVGEAAERGRDGGDLADALLEREALPLAHPVLQEVAVGLGAVVAVEVGAAVGGADDHVRVGLGLPRALDPLRRLGPPEELDGEVLGQREVEHGVGRVDAELGGDVDERAADELLVLGLRHLVDVQHVPVRRRQRRALRRVAVGVLDRVADRVAERRVAQQRDALVARSVASVNMRWNSSAPS